MVGVLLPHEDMWCWSFNFKETFCSLKQGFLSSLWTTQLYNCKLYLTLFVQHPCAIAWVYMVRYLSANYTFCMLLVTGTLIQSFCTCPLLEKYLYRLLNVHHCRNLKWRRRENTPPPPSWLCKVYKNWVPIFTECLPVCWMLSFSCLHVMSKAVSCLGLYQSVLFISCILQSSDC